MILFELAESEWVQKMNINLHSRSTSCFYAVKPCAVYNTKVIPLSAKKDSFPTTQKSCVVHEFLCPCEARKVRRTT